jgi:hypothetical protein
MIDDSQICMPCIISITHELETQKGLGSLGKPLRPPVDSVQLCADHTDMQLGIERLFFSLQMSTRRTGWFCHLCTVQEGLSGTDARSHMCTMAPTTRRFQDLYTRRDGFSKE